MLIEYNCYQVILCTVYDKSFLAHLSRRVIDELMVQTGVVNL